MPTLCYVLVSLASCADVGLPAVSEQQMGVKEVRGMVQLTLRMLAEPYSKLSESERQVDAANFSDVT